MRHSRCRLLWACAILLLVVGLSACGDAGLPVSTGDGARKSSADHSAAAGVQGDCENQPQGDTASPRGAAVVYRIAPEAFGLSADAELVEREEREIQLGFPERYPSDVLPEFARATGPAAVDSGSVTKWLVDQAIGEATNGAAIHVPVRRSGNVVALIAERPDGTAVLLSCNLYAPLLQAFADDQAASGGEGASLDALLSLYSPDEALRASAEEALREYRARAETSAPAWSEQDPMARSAIGPEVPPEVKSQLHMVHLDVEVPDTWRRLEAKLCTRSSVGWNVCFDLRNVDLYRDGRVNLVAFVLEGEPLEVWLKPVEGEVGDVVGRIGVIPLEHFANESVPVVSPGDSARSVTDLTELRTSIDQGEQILQVESQ